MALTRCCAGTCEKTAGTQGKMPTWWRHAARCRSWLLRTVLRAGGRKALMLDSIAGAHESKRAKQVSKACETSLNGKYGLAKAHAHTVWLNVCAMSIAAVLEACRLLDACAPMVAVHEDPSASLHVHSNTAASMCMPRHECLPQMAPQGACKTP